MTLSIRRVVLESVSASGPETPDAGRPGQAPPVDAGTVSSWTAKPGLTRAGAFEQHLPAVLAALDERRPGSTVVANSLKQALTGALVAPGLEPATREARVLEALLPMLQAGRGPALVGLRTVLESNLPLPPASREAIREALGRIEAAATGGADEALTALMERAPIPPESVRDVARLGWLLNQGTEAQRSETVMRVLLLDARSPLGHLCEQARAVVLEGRSAQVRFSAEQQESVKRLMREWPSASPSRRSELASTQGPLFNLLERALGGAMVGSPPGFAAEQAARGNPLPTWLSDPRTTMLENDLSLMKEAERLMTKLPGGSR